MTSWAAGAEEDGLLLESSGTAAPVEDGRRLLRRSAKAVAGAVALLALAGLAVLRHPAEAASRPATSAAFSELIEQADASTQLADDYTSELPDSDIEDRAPNQTLHRYSMKSFKKFAKKVLLANDLSHEEIKAFKQRFIKKMHTYLANGHTMKQFKAKAWKKIVKMALNAEKPVVTAKMIERINEAKLGWKASRLAAKANMTNEQFQKFLGLHPKFSSALSSIKLSNAAHVDMATEFLKRGNLPQAFDVRQKWPECTEVFDHLRDQGQCASCWAQATASVMESHRCIYTGARFSGPRAWLSAGYIASCYQEPGEGDGCSPGNPLYSLQQAFIAGVPTGAGSGTSETCNPYFAGGKSLLHTNLEDNMKSPPCPIQCTSKEYPRAMADDMFYITPNIQGIMPTDKHQVAQVHLMETGPVIMAMKIYSDFMAYGGGYYSPGPGAEVEMGHAVALQGWSHYEGKLFWTALNWWKVEDEWWGEDGKFKIDADCCLISYVYIQTKPGSKADSSGLGTADILPPVEVR